ncbi:hypothetical protein C2G38_2079435, partial [Gigaspora rosea]
MGIAQNPGLPSDSENWTHENFLALKTTLQNCLPHIRYFQMSGDDIFNNTTRNTEPFSTVINEAHAAEIASWVDKKENTYSLTNIPYEFKLLLRGTRDGFTADSFWKLRDKQRQLIVVMKVKGTDEILGGYNPIGWDKSVYH